MYDDTAYLGWFWALDGCGIPSTVARAWKALVHAVIPSPDGVWVQLEPAHAPGESIVLHLPLEAAVEDALAALAALDLSATTSLPRLVTVEVPTRAATS